MKISGIGRTGSVQAAKHTKRTKRAGAKGKDAVRVAEAEALREKIRAVLAEMPEVRIERIEALRDAIAEGRYEVPAREVARKIVLNALAEAPW